MLIFTFAAEVALVIKDGAFCVIYTYVKSLLLIAIRGAKSKRFDKVVLVGFRSTERIRP